MRRSWFGFALICLLVVAMHAGPAYAQGSASSSLSGTVVDSSGAVVPGAEVTIKNKATGESYSAVSGANGGWTVPAISAGNYAITIALMGFKTAQLTDIAVSAAVPAVIGKTVLELGKLEETVVVEASTEVVQTQSTSVATTLNANQISRLPLPGRAAFDFVALLPGVTSSDGSTRGSIVNGLPTALVNITLDGMNIQDNYAKSWDGMFTRVSPRLDAVEEVTVGTAAGDAGGSGQGAVQVKFVTRAGTNQFKGSLYYYLRRDWMNTNTWYNLNQNFLPRPTQAQYQPGGRLGGPIVIPGLFDGHDKAFFFINYEDLRTPGTVTNTRTIMSPSSERGDFVYGSRTVNVLQLAAASGQQGTIDPKVAAILAGIRSSVGGGAQSSTDPLVQTFPYAQKTKGITKYPTARLDYNLTSKHRLSGSITQNHLVSDPDTTNSYQTAFPGFPVHGLQDSYRWTSQLSVRSTISANMVNEVRLGGTGGATLFAPDLASSMFDTYGGYGIAINGFKGITNPYPISANSGREGSTRVIEDTLSWIKGSHSLSMGASYTQADVWYLQQQSVPTVTLGMATGDPADGLFTTANFPGASSTDLTNARNLYAVLTGRVTAINRNARIAADGTTFVILGPSRQEGRMKQFGFYLQDSWKWKPSLTINAGLRWDPQMPFYALNNSYSTATMADLFGASGLGTGFVPGSTVDGLGNMFTPGATGGSPTTYKQLSKDTNAYNVDWNNLAPSIGAAWKVPARKGFVGRIFGDDSVLRAGFNIAYQRPGMSDFTGIFGGNPGVSINAIRNQTNGNLGTPPVLLSSSDLGPPNITLARTYPMPVPDASSSVYAFDPNIKTAYSTSFTFGWQRALGKSMAVEARFIHTGSHQTWWNGQMNPLNYNEINIVENNFVNEFRTAQANLYANIAAGKGNTFAYTGAPGTAALPTFLAYLSGSSDVSNTAKYTGSGWTNSTLVQSMYTLNPNPRTAASNLATNATYKANAATAGLPANWFLVNPTVSGAYLVTNGPDTRYNGLQLEFRRRFAQGLQFNANYAYGIAFQQTFYGFHKPMIDIEQNYTSIYSNQVGNATGNVRHVFAASWVYELPFGQGKRFGSGVGRNVNRAIGNWTFMGTARVQSGRMVDFGNVRMIGMTPQQLQDMYFVRLSADPNVAYKTIVQMLPQDVIDNTIKAFSVGVNGYSAGAPTGRYFAPANGPDCVETTPGFGDCGVRSVIVTGPKVVRVDMSIGKQIAIVGRTNIEFQLQVFNVLNRVNFNPNVYTGVTTTSYLVTGAVDQQRYMQMALRFSF